MGAGPGGSAGAASTNLNSQNITNVVRYGQTNIDRVEVIKGPNAGIYGRTSPGGMLNMISMLFGGRIAEEVFAARGIERG